MQKLEVSWESRCIGEFSFALFYMVIHPFNYFYVNTLSACVLLASACDQNIKYLSVYDGINFIHKVAKGRLETMSFTRIFVNLHFKYLLLTSTKKTQDWVFGSRREDS